MPSKIIMILPDMPDQSSSSKEGPSLHLIRTVVEGINVLAVSNRRTESLVSFSRIRPSIERITDLKRPLVLDLSGAGTLDSSAIGGLIGLTRQCHEAGGVLVLAGVYPHILELLQKLKLERQLACRMTVEEAVLELLRLPMATYLSLVAGNPTAEEARFRSRRRATTIRPDDGALSFG